MIADIYLRKLHRYKSLAYIKIMNNSGSKSFEQRENSGTINNADTMNFYNKDVSHSSPLYKFSSLIADKTEGFVGREYVFEAIQKFLEENSKGYFTIIGDPGMGKSAILAKYVQDTGCIAYFNVQLQLLNQPNQFLESVCKQLIDRYHLLYDHLPSDATRDGKFLGQLLDEVYQKRNGKPVIIAVDALDEVDPDSYGRNANILYLPPNLPDGFYFIMTRRRGVDVPFMTDAPMSVFNLLDYPVESQRDVRVRIQNRVDGSEKLRQQINERQETIPEFIEKIADKSENNFMYLRYVLLDIEKGLYKDLNLESFPQGLQGYYDFHWRRMGMKAEPLPRTKINIVYILSEIRKPASIQLICKFAKEEELTVQKVLDEWLQFLHEQRIDKLPCYSIYHASFQDFLHRKDIVQAAKVNIGEINGMIAKPLLDRWNKILRKRN